MKKDIFEILDNNLFIIATFMFSEKGWKNFNNFLRTNQLKFSKRKI